MSLKYETNMVLLNTLNTSNKTTEFTNSIDPDEVAHTEPPHQDLHCLSSSLLILNMIQLDKTIIEIFADVNFIVCFLALKS